jgi:hypothetical protein
MGLQINWTKADKNGWQPANVERVMSGVCVNSPLGTQLPSEVIAGLLRQCEKLLAGARSVAPHTLVGLAKRRRSVQGWINQASQADISPVGDLQPRLHQIDSVILSKLRGLSICLDRAWYTKDKWRDEANHIAAVWLRRRRHGSRLSIAA